MLLRFVLMDVAYYRPINSPLKPHVIYLSTIPNLESMNFIVYPNCRLLMTLNSTSTAYIYRNIVLLYLIQFPLSDI